MMPTKTLPPSRLVASEKELAALVKKPERLKAFLDEQVVLYKTPAYVASDPICFPYRYLDNPKACEWVGFLAALLSYGRREKILETLHALLMRMQNDPWRFLENFDAKRDRRLFQDFVYRFNKGPDLLYLFQRLQWVYREYDSLEAFFLASGLPPEASLKAKMESFLDRFAEDLREPSYGLKFLLAHPANGGACKRFQMYLRWMVRQDIEAESRVDLGLWKKALQPKDLLIPLDTHVAQMARRLNLTQRNANDWQTAEEITAIFRSFYPEDPAIYDYALFGFSLAQAGRPIPQRTSTSSFMNPDIQCYTRDTASLESSCLL